MSSVSIIGAGTMARILGTLAVQGGNDVEVIGRDPAKAAGLARALGRGATAGTLGAAPAGDIVILAVPWAKAALSASRLASQLRTVSIAKGSVFCLPQYLESYAAGGRLAAADRLRGLARGPPHHAKPCKPGPKHYPHPPCRLGARACPFCGR
jgi:hypothetical protein